MNQTTDSIRAVGRPQEQIQNHDFGFENRHAFIVGINDYQKVASLTTPVNDAQQLAAVLKIDYNFIIHDLNNPTGDILRGYLDNMANTVGINDCVVFYFAGHGIALDDEKGLKGFLVPTDADINNEASLIPMSFMMACFEKLKARHFLLILDCCFAGAFRWAEKYRDVLTINDTLFQQHYHYYTQNPSWQVLTSASHTQKALDRLGGRHETDNDNSPFARCLIEGLKGQADGNKDKIITATELYSFLQQRIPIITGAKNNLQNVGFFPLEKHGNGEFMFLPSDFDSTQLRLKDYENPYKGLQAYEASDAHLFFGRKKAIEVLLEKIEQQNFIVVVGASGTGKSSLVKAGIVPVLQKQGKRVQTLRPGKDPFAELPKNNTDFDVLVIDQFEEIITQADADSAAKFMDILRGWLSKSEKTLILTVRIDFESQIDKKGIEAAWRSGRYLIPPFTPEELREVIITPAARVGRFIDPIELVDDIISEVVHYPGSLPLLSFTMSELFDKCKDDPFRNIRRVDYVELGGVIGSLQKSADRIVADLTEVEQQTLKNMMLRMVSLSGGEIAGKKVMLKDLVFDKKDENERVEVLKNKLIEARLIVPNTDSNNQPFLEPAHDALVRAWTKLINWVKIKGETNLLLHHKLTEEASNYTLTQDKRHLWHNNPSLEILRVGNIFDFNQSEMQFIADSVAEKERREKIRRRELMLAFSLLSLLLIGVSYFAYRSNANAKEADKNAQIASNKQREAEDALNKFLIEKKEKDKAKADDILRIVEKGIELGKYEEQLKRLEEFKNDGNNDPRIRQEINKIKEIIKNKKQ